MPLKIYIECMTFDSCLIYENCAGMRKYNINL